MGQKNKYLFIEILFTFLLLAAAISLLSNIPSIFRLYFILSLMGAFSFSLLIRDKQALISRIFLNIGVLAVFAWIVYSISNSSLVQKEVISTFIKGSIILEIILSLDSCYPRSLFIIQALSLPIFMSFPIFTKVYNEAQVIAVLVYAICWIVIIRIKFYQFLKPPKQKESKRYLSIIVAVIIFLLSISICLFISHKLSLGKIERGGFLLMEEKEADTENQTTEKDYYYSQDKVQKEISKIIPVFNSKEDRYEMLILLSSLIKEPSHTKETRKARLGLISLLKNLGPGLEKAQGKEILVDIEDYLDKKVLFNLNNSKEDITNSLKNNKINIMERFSITDLLDKMQNSKSIQEIKEYEKKIKQKVNKFSAGSDTKRDLFRSIEDFKEWKVLQAYRQESDSLNEEIDSLEKELKKEIADLASSIDNIDNLSELKKAEEQLKEFKKAASPRYKDMVEKIKGVFDSKVELLLSEKSASLKEKVDSLNLPGNDSQALSEGVDEIKDSQDFRELSKSSEEYREGMQANGIRFNENMEELSQIKSHLIFNEEKGKIEEILSQSNLPDKGDGLIKDFANFELEKNDNKLISNSKKLKENLEKLSGEGFISGASKDNLIKKVEDAGNFFQNGLKDGVGPGSKQGEGEKPGETEQKGYSEGLSKEGPSKEEKKLKLIKISPDTLEVASGETGKFSASGVYSDDSQKDLTNLGEWSSSDDKIALISTGKIKAISAGDARIYMEYEGIKSKPALVKVTGPKLLSIILTPQDLRMSMREKTALKAEEYFSDSSRKDITPLADWEVLDPRIIKIEKGKISPLKFGETKVYAGHLGKKSLPANIKVIFTIDWLAYMIAKIMLLIFLGIAVIFTILYVLTEKKKDNIMASLEKDPRAFIIELYANTKKILCLFNLSCKGNIAPLSYAEFIQKECAIVNNIFLRFTVKFEEAGYSGHVLSKSDAASALSDYNDFLKVLCSRHNKMYLFIKYCQAIFHITPLFIPERQHLS